MASNPTSRAASPALRTIRNDSPGSFTCPEDVLEEAIEGLAGCDETVLSETVCGGILDPNLVVEWVDRAKRLLRFRVDPDELRSEVPAVADGLFKLLEQVEKELKKAKRRNKAVTIDYGAKWCPPCRRMKPIYAKMSREFRDACAFLAVDVDKARDASTAAKIQCMPTFHFYAKDGEKIEEEVLGLDVGKLRRILTKDLGCEARAEEEEEILATPGPGTVKDLQEKKRE